MHNPNPVPWSRRHRKPANRGMRQPRARSTNRVGPALTAQAGVPTTSLGLQAAGTAQVSQPAGAYQYNYVYDPGAPHAAAAYPGSAETIRNSEEALVAGGYGDPGGPTPEDFESTMEQYRTLFFEKKLGPFQAWQVFIMWMAITGLIVYIASLIGFRRTLVDPKTSTLSHTHIYDYAYPGDVNGTCDDFTSCRGEAECQDGRCACLPPLFVVVDGICSKASREQSVVDIQTQAETGDLLSSTVRAKLAAFYKVPSVETVIRLTPVSTNSKFLEQLPTSFLQNSAPFSETVASNSSGTARIDDNGSKHY